MSRPVLVLLNGLPAGGKSTLARAWCERHAAALPMACDVDVLRGMLGGWRDSPLEAGVAARALAVAALGAQLREGRDAVVPQHLRRPAFAEALRVTAEAAGAAFLECVVVVDPEEAERYFLARAAAGQGLAEGPLEPPMPLLAAEFDRFLAARPDAVALRGDRDALLDALDRAVTAARAAGSTPR